MKLIKFISALLFFSLIGQQKVRAQASSGDCIGAIPVCQLVYDVPVLSVPPDNEPGEINGFLSCLANGEENGVWYTFTVQTTGILSFNIIPYVGTDDYDWALFNLTNSTCDQINNDVSLAVSCNFSSSTVNGGITGANNGPNPQDESTVAVNAGQRFVLYISNFSQSNDGYKLDFSASTAQVPDNVPPVFISAQPNLSCNASSIVVQFSENIECASVQPADFVLNGPGGPYTITSITSSDCQAGAAYSTQYTLNLTPVISSGGNFSLAMTGTISDICGNNADATLPPLNFSYNALSLVLNIIDADCGVNNGQASVAVAGGIPPYLYLWNDPLNQTTSTAVGLARGTYIVTVTDAQGCSTTQTVVVSDPTSFNFDVVQQADTCSKGVGQLVVMVNGTTAPYQYEFQDQNGTITGSNAVFTGAVGDSSVYIRVTDNLGCYRDSVITVNNISNDSLLAFFTVDKTVVNVLFPYATFVNASQYYDSFYWNIDNTTQTQDNFTYHFTSGEGAYPVTITVADVNGCTDSYTMIIEVIAEFALFIPNAFTRNNDGLNDIFLVKGTGFREDTFEMYIYDRLGRCIFQSNDINQGWDGSTQITDAQFAVEGVYVYRIDVIDNFDVKHQFTGKLVLIR
jgi:gliding motility-associated-like protein